MTPDLPRRRRGGGWKLVPVEPTPEMMDAAAAFPTHLAASPPPPETREDIALLHGWKPGPEWRYAIGDPVQKTKGSSWHGHVVGFYTTTLTPRGYAVESEREPGSVQIYPEAALRQALRAAQA